MEEEIMRMQHEIHELRAEILEMKKDITNISMSEYQEMSKYIEIFEQIPELRNTAKDLKRQLDKLVVYL